MIKFVVISFFNKTIEFDVLNKLDNDLIIKLNSSECVSNKFYYDYKFFELKTNKIIKMLKNRFSTLQVENLIIKNVNILDIILLNLNNLNLPNLNISIDESLTREEYEKIINYKNLKDLICYYIPPIYRNKLDIKNISYSFNYNKFVSDKFMLNNDCIDHDTLYYKKNITLKDDSPQMLQDLNEFLKLNHNLKVIHLYKYSNEFILNVINILKKWHEFNVIIYLYQNNDFNIYINKNFNELRNINKKYNKVLQGEIRIKYSKQYIIKNLFKQLSFNNLKMMIIIIAYVALVIIFFNEFNSFVSTNNMNELSNLIETPEDSEEAIEEQIKSKYDFEQIFSKLIEINNETVGWLTVNNTNINYPVVKHADNDYYLHRDFYKTKTSSGWVFMDYRNNVEELNDNTIIYGHRLKNDTIFGSLDLVLNKSWYTNPNNLIIAFNSIYENMQWQVFSIYKVDYTVDYLKTNFYNEEEFNQFISLISKRSVYNFNNSLNYGDKILTLSTCIGTNNKRLVLHAKLIKE